MQADLVILGNNLNKKSKGNLAFFMSVFELLRKFYRGTCTCKRLACFSFSLPSVRSSIVYVKTILGPPVETARTTNWATAAAVFFSPNSLINLPMNCRADTVSSWGQNPQSESHQIDSGFMCQWFFPTRLKCISCNEWRGNPKPDPPMVELFSLVHTGYGNLLGNFLMGF